MGELRYLISDASKKLNIEPHVLRHWEDELKLNIQRNELGHRYYSEENLIVFEKVKDLKKDGYPLKAIKMIMQNNKMNEINTDNEIQSNIKRKVMIKSNNYKNNVVTNDGAVKVKKRIEEVLTS